MIRSDAFRAGRPRASSSGSRNSIARRGFYHLIRHPTKPKLIGNNVGIWRSDFERVNGYDENFEGWGCEDDDLRFRLRRAGRADRIDPALDAGLSPLAPASTPRRRSMAAGANVGYLLRKGRLTRCLNGLVKRRHEDLAIRIVGRAEQPRAVARLVAGKFTCPTAERPEIEILFLPGEGRFTGEADCNVVVAARAGGRALAAGPPGRLDDPAVRVRRRPLDAAGATAVRPGAAQGRVTSRRRRRARIRHLRPARP